MSFDEFPLFCFLSFPGFRILIKDCGPVVDSERNFGNFSSLAYGIQPKKWQICLEILDTTIGIYRFLCFPYNKTIGCLVNSITFK